MSNDFDQLFDAAVESFPWDSPEDKKSYLAFIQYERQFGFKPKLPLDTTVTFFIQKLREGGEYLTDAIGGQIHTLQNDLKRLKDESRDLRNSLESLRDAVRAQSDTIRALINTQP